MLESSSLEYASKSKIGRELKGRRFTSTQKHGKYLLARLNSGRFLMVHFGMTGYLAYLERDRTEPCHTRLLLCCRNGKRLAYVNQRKLGKIGLVEDIEKFLREKSLGPDSLNAGFTFTRFKKLLSTRKAKIKSVLMNQKVIAGIGNVYADEILFQTGVHPETRATSLDDKTLRLLFRKMREVLQKTIRYQADAHRMPRTFLLPNRSPGNQCPRDAHKLRTVKISGRTAYYCPAHQVQLSVNILPITSVPGRRRVT